MKRLISLFMTVLMLFSMFSFLDASVSAAFTAPKGRILTTLKEYNIAPGIKEKHIVTNNAQGTHQVKSYVAIADMKNSSVGFLAGYKDYDSTGKWGLQTVRDQAVAAENATGRNVVVGVNADFSNMQTGEPFGALIMDGKVVKPPNGEPCYFAILKDGTPVIRDSSVPYDDVQYAVGAPFYLVRNGKAIKSSDADPMPRCALGITKDNEVIIYTADGRRAPISCGETISSTAQMLEALGCVVAVNLDGGGSATFASQIEGETAMTVKNTPSDGTERKVGSTVLIYSTAKSTGVFDHANISPYNELYTPGSSVQFTATGVDSAGVSLALPEDGQFMLDDSSFGTITKDGLFTSNGKTGKVVVNYVHNGEICGSTYVEVVIPDEMYVPSKEVSLGFEESTDFGIVAKYKYSDVNLNKNDIIWSIKDEAGNDLGTSAGVFDGLTFTTPDKVTINANITAAFACNPSVSVTIHTVIGAMPKVIYDFEYTTDKSDTSKKYIPSYNLPAYLEAEGANATFAKKSKEAGYPLYNWVNTALSDKSAMVSTIVSKDDGEPVRFGDNALKIHYSFESYNGSSNGNCYLRVTDEAYKFEGTPSAIGCWIYATNKIDTLSMYLNCVNKNGNITYASVTPGGNGIDWTGWKYVEIDLTDPSLGNNLGVQNAPFGFNQGSGVFWISYQPGGTTGTTTESTIYIDNIQLIYGANTDDVNNPIVKTMSANNEDIVDGKTVLTSSKNTFKASFADVDGKYSSGIDKEKMYMFIDGVDVTDKCYINKGDDEIYFYDAELSNGVHTLTATVYDVFGNSTTESCTFTVNAEAPGVPKIEYTAVSETASLGAVYSTVIKAEKPADIKEMDVEVKVTSKFAKYWSNYSIISGSNFKVTKGPSYNADTGIISFGLSRNADADASKDDGIVAKLDFSIPTNVPEGLEVTYSIIKGSVVASAAASDKKIYSFSGSVSTKCVSPFSLEIEPMIVGSKGGYITVRDLTGAVVSGVDVKTTSGVLLGTTDENGQIFTDKFVSKIVEFSVFAQKGNVLSTVNTTQSYKAGATEDGLPAFVKLNAVKEPSVSQSISWMAHPVNSGKEAVVLYATKADYEANADASLKTFNAVSKVQEMASSGSLSENYAVRINSALLTGLSANTEYVYKVGDGTKMSELKSFKTTSGEKAGTSFFVIGDTQAEDTTNLDLITKELAKEEFDFGIQTGDAIDNGGNYAHWSKINNIFAGDYLGTKPIVHVLGNHEYYGDKDGSSSAAYFDLPGSKNNVAPPYYSIVYENVYVAVINYTGADGYREAAEWLKKDAFESDADWKIVTMHQPPYYTNPIGSSSALQEILVPAFDDAGIDVVFSGHDHAYARTKPMIAGQVDDNGTVYYICGSTGEKSYDIVFNDSFNFDVTSDNFNATYLTAKATADELLITSYDYAIYDDGQTDVRTIDTYTVISKCASSGHQNVYSDGNLECKVCGKKSSLEGFTGFVNDKETGLLMRFTEGKPSTGWVAYVDDNYYFDNNGCAVTGEQKIDGKTYTFDNEGRFVKGCIVDEEVTMDNGEKRIVTRYYMAGGIYATKWTEIDGHLYYFSKPYDYIDRPDDGAMYRLGTFTIRTPGANTLRKFTFDFDGHLTNGCWEDDKDINGEYVGTRYYWGPNYVTGERVIDGITYNFDDRGYVTSKDITNLPVTYDDTAVLSGKPVTPSVTIKDGDVTLTNKVHYTLSYENNNAIGTGTIIITGNESRGYTGTKRVEFDVVLGSAQVRASSENGTVTLSWNAVPGATGYEIRQYDPASDTWTKIASITDTKYVVSDLTVDNEYKFKVATYAVIDNSKMFGEYSNEVSSVVQPVLPVMSAVTAKNTKSYVKLSWKAVDGATEYYIYRYNETKKVYDYIGMTKGLSFSDKNVSAGSEYSYKVRASFIRNNTKYPGPLSKEVKIVFNVTIGKISKLTLASKSNYVKVSWSKVSGATEYLVYRYNSKTKTYDYIGKSKKTYYNDKKVKNGSKYYYKVKASYVKDGKTYYGDLSDKKSIKYSSTLGKTTKITATATTNSIKLTWKKVTSAVGYTIYRYDSSKKKYVKIGSTKKLSYTNKKLKSGKKYTYMVKAYTKINGVVYRGKGVKFYASTNPVKVKSLKVSSSKAKNAALSWNKVANATGYEVYRATSKNGKYTKVATISKGKTVKYTNSKLKSGKTYFYKVRAVIKTDSGNFKGSFSDIKSVKVK